VSEEGAAASGPTCGQGLAENAPLPGRVAQLIASMADILVIHMGALDLSDESAQREHVAYRELAEALRDAPSSGSSWPSGSCSIFSSSGSSRIARWWRG
jgi:hypothetical protein